MSKTLRDNSYGPWLVNRDKLAGNPKRGTEKTMKSIECPHCGEQITEQYVNKALELYSSAEYENDEQITDEDDDGAEKAVTGPTNYVGNKKDATRGPHKMGKMHSSSRAKSGEAIQRKQRPTNPTTECGVVKSLRLPIIDGNPRLVEYSHGLDEHVAKSIQAGTNHVPPARNLRAEQELSGMEGEIEG